MKIHAQKTYLFLQVTFGNENFFGVTNFLVALHASPLLVLDLPDDDGGVFGHRHHELVVERDLHLRDRPTVTLVLRPLARVRQRKLE